MCDPNLQQENNQVKACTKCGEEKPLSEFGKKKSNKDGLQYWCKACSRAAYSKWEKENQGRAKKRKAEWHKANRSKSTARQAEYYAANKEKIAARKAEYRKANKEKIAAYATEYRKANPDKRIAGNQRRRASKLNAAGTFTAEQAKARFDYHGSKCIYCGSTENLHVEHMIPLSKGGSNWPANLAPACGSCNSSKCNKSFWEFTGKQRPRG